MAAGVFGAPITLDTLKASSLYPPPITQRNCSDYALKMKTAGGKDVDAAKYVDNLSTQYGSSVSAKCLIYNATGTTLEYVMTKDFHGHVQGNPCPETIENGQWGCFLHVHPYWGFGICSSAAVVYRTLRPDSKNEYCDWCFSWRMPFGRARSNMVLTKIQEKDYFKDSVWEDFENKLYDLDISETEDKNYGYLSKIMAAQGKDAEIRGTFKMTPP